MKKKRLLALLMAGAMAVSMTACNGGGDSCRKSGSGAASGSSGDCWRRQGLLHHCC